ncbi:lysylphosphatidylglycerol synthase transmembrane domain-containing protein [Magnetovibrio sp. PR-2]|uniref:lysylphosphatidylglycerol synthase transmembrane domain-containing protein n=1 Tax=Magnetovibrio sp. PR-2 TaxID=3120356 RepID=UPI002FCE0B0C
MTLRKSAPLLAKLVVSIGLLSWLFINLDTSSLLAYVNVATLSTVVALAMVNASFTFVLAYRWGLILSFLKSPLTLINAGKNIIIGMFFNQVLPSTIGGDVVRIWLAKRWGLSISVAANSIISDRIFGFMGLVLLCLFGWPFVYSLTENELMTIGEGIVIGIGISGVVSLYVIQHFPVRWKQMKVLSWLVGISNASIGVIVNSGSGTRIVVLSIIMHIFDITMVFIVAQVCDIALSWTTCAILLPPALLVSAAPISIAGWGVREGVVVFALGAAGVGVNEAIILSLFYGLIHALTGLIGGMVWVMTPHDELDLEREEELVNHTV